MLAAIATFLSAGLTIARECVSDYQAFNRDAVEAGEYIRNRTPREAVFVTGTQHLNPVVAIAGRTIVCGPDLWLYWHGFDTSERQEDLRIFYEDPEGHPEIPQRYGADYIYVSSYERSEYSVDEAALDRFLEAYRTGGLEKIKRKAVITPTNLGWTLYELAEQLGIESREA